MRKLGSVPYVNRVDNSLEAIIGHNGLRKLTIADAKIRKGGSDALGMLLWNPKTNLTSLTLNATKMYESRRPFHDFDYYHDHNNDSNNESDKEEDNDEVGVEMVKTKDEEIDDNIDDDADETGARAVKFFFASGLCNNVTLKELEIVYMGHVPSQQNSVYPKKTTQITNAGWKAIFVTLQSLKCRLEKLNQHDSKSIGASILSLPCALQNHANTLKTLINVSW